MNEAEGLSLTPAAPKPTPEQAKYLALVRDLTNSAATLVVKIATCKCDKKDACKVYLQAQRMADIIDKLGDIREGERVGPSATITEGRRKVGKRRGNV